MTRALILAVAALTSLTLAACGPPKPDAIELHRVDSHLTRAPIATGATLQEGDLLVIDANAVDDDESTELCIDASSTAPATVRVSRVRGKCRQFVVLATAPGTARVRFEARDRVNELAFEILSAR